MNQIGAKAVRMKTRRAFLKEAVAFSGALSLAPPDARAATDEPRLVLGVLGDVHVRAGDTGVFSATKVSGILEYFRQRNVDGVLCTGDVADRGLEEDFRAFAAEWFRVFPGDRRPDGARVERLFVYGNHDVLGMRKADDPADARMRAEMWEKVWHEPFERIVRKTVKGVPFFGLHWENSGFQDIAGQHAALREALAAADPSRPFLFAQHRHLRGTCYSASGTLGDAGETTAALRGHANVLAFSGHSHYPLTDETGFWRGDFTSVGTGAVAADPGHRPGRENGGEAAVTEALSMPILMTGTGTGRPLLSQAMVMSVFDDRIVLERRDFAFGEPLGPDWTVPRPFVPVDAKAALAARMKAAADDRLTFPDAEVRLSAGWGTNRAGERERQVTVSFAPAVAKGGTRAYDYEVVASEKYADWTRPLSVKRIHPEDFYLPPGHAPAACACVFSARELGLADRRMRRFFSVEAIDSYGNRHARIAGSRFIDILTETKDDKEVRA